MGIYHNDPEKAKAMRAAQRRLAWIENTKRTLHYTQEQAEAAWTRIFNTPTKQNEG